MTAASRETNIPNQSAVTLKPPRRLPFQFRQELSQIVREKGLKEALKFRDSQFDTDIARV